MALGGDGRGDGDCQHADHGGDRDHSDRHDSNGHDSDHHKLLCRSRMADREDRPAGCLYPDDGEHPTHTR